MYDIVDLVSGEFLEGGFESYGAAQRYFEEMGYDYDTVGIVEADDEVEVDSEDGYSFPGWSI